MSANLHLELDHAEALRVLGSLAARLNEKEMRRLIARSQNEAVITAKAEAKRAIRDIYRAPAKEIERTISVKKSSNGNLQARLKLQGRMSVELMHYGAKAGKKGVSVAVLKSSKRAPIKAGGDTGILTTKKKKIAAIWIAKGHVLARIEKKDHPIMLWGPSFLARMSDAGVQDRIRSVASTRYISRIEHHTARLLEGKS